MKLHVVSIATAALLIAGCVTGYKPVPEGVPTSQVRFVSLDGEGGPNIYVALFDNEKCEGRINAAALSGIAINHHRNNLGMPLGEEFSEKVKTEIPMRADRPLIYTMGFHIGGVYSSGQSCDVTAIFVPKESHYYEATFSVVNNKCVTQVYEITKNDAGKYIRVPERSARKSASPCNL